MVMRSQDKARKSPNPPRQPAQKQQHQHCDMEPSLKANRLTGILQRALFQDLRRGNAGLIECVVAVVDIVEIRIAKRAAVQASLVGNGGGPNDLISFSRCDTGSNREDQPLLEGIAEAPDKVVALGSIGHVCCACAEAVGEWLAGAWVASALNATRNVILQNNRTPIRVAVAAHGVIGCNGQATFGARARWIVCRRHATRGALQAWPMLQAILDAATAELMAALDKTDSGSVETAGLPANWARFVCGGVCRKT